MRRLCNLLVLTMLVTAVTAQEPRSALADILAAGPISAAGHGVLFGHDGRAIRVTPEFALGAQSYYIDSLYKSASRDQQAQFSAMRSRIFGDNNWNAADRGSANAALIAWLLQATNPPQSAKLASINNTLRRQPAGGVIISRRMQQALQREGLSGARKTASVTAAFSTSLSGQDYIDQCASVGVPIPPAWGTAGWVDQGPLTTNFLGGQADLYTFQTNSPEGICMALPRSSGGTIALLGVICQGKQTGNVCFWDNADVPWGAVVPLKNFVGGADLVGGDVCSDCHSGENAFVVHPNTVLDLGGALKPNTWHKPLVPSSWPDNPGPSNLLSCVALNSKDESCLSCHGDGSGRRFSELSTDVSGFCNSVLSPALAQTMPPGNPGDSAYAKHMSALATQCASAPVAVNDDYDKDCVKNAFDNCPSDPNPGQENSDPDSRGDACDNCLLVSNNDQKNTDGANDGGDACDVDDDNDGCLDGEDDKPALDASVVGWRLAVNCASSTKKVWGWDGEDSDGDGLRNCKDKDDDNDGTPDASDQCPVNPPNGGIASMECQKSPVSCPLQVWWDVCLAGGCNEFLVKIVSVINPDPTIVIDKFTIRGRDVYLQPSAAQGLAQIEDALQAKAQQVGQQFVRKVGSSGMSLMRSVPGNRLRLEVWSRDTRETRGQLIATLAEYDPIAVRHLEPTDGAALKMTFVDDGRAIQIERSAVPRVDDRGR